MYNLLLLEIMLYEVSISMILYCWCIEQSNILIDCVDYNEILQTVTLSKLGYKQDDSLV